MGRPMIPSPMSPIGPCMTSVSSQSLAVARGDRQVSSHARAGAWTGSIIGAAEDPSSGARSPSRRLDAAAAAGPELLLLHASWMARMVMSVPSARDPR